MILPALPIGFALVAVTALAAVAAKRSTVPPSIFLVLVGLGLSFIPGMPRVALRPDLVLTLLLPPLLYSAGVGMSWRGFKANIRPILLMAVGCVIFTAASVALVAHYLLDLSWALGFVLGAIVAPPDAVAPMAIAKRFPIPSRVLVILEGEGLVNDATALILFSFAIAAVIEGGRFSPGTAVGSFAAIVAGEIAWGLLVGWIALNLRRWAHEPRVEIILAMLTPFAAFWVPESLGGSGVLATVTAGLFVSWNGPRFIAPATRLQGYFVWDLMVYLIEGVIFLLTGLQAPVIADSLAEADWVRLGLAAASVTAAIILVRFAWVYASTYLPCWLWPAWRRRNPAPAWQEVFAIAFTGIRGVVSLAAALSIPLMAGPAPFPERGLLLLVTFVVILATLVGQGFSFAWVIQKLGLTDLGKREADAAKQHEVAARVAGIDAALSRLDRLKSAGLAPEMVEILRRRHGDRRAYFVAACRDLETGQAVANAMAVQLEFLATEREAIAKLYTDGALDDEARRRIERELDLDESRIRHAAESGASHIS
ncbi:MAG TPA: Na+/H+ antiporter [Rhizomicrobium sp.]|nr:Na+/H+ antiporter [Rhizomicrobium sp.]